ncbi:DUF2807 domain-containing protein [Halosquirtibacter xylanolyticus]|uniref:GIN domain-containing protein n=1 Tax=Halosquirtibacter xylanolyticus TaxID=3374599 RepID=UPI0037488FB1|nr:DUF2807 domain-containing protein [Prolixibacteraceae bacterium]
MKTNLIIVGILCSTILMGGCSKSDDTTETVTTTNTTSKNVGGTSTTKGDMTKTKYSVSNFIDLTASLPMDVEITFVEENRTEVTIECDAAIADKYTVKQNGTSIDITKKDGVKEIKTKNKTTAHITVKTLSAIKGLGASTIKFKNKLKREDLTLTLDEASSLTGDIEINMFVFDGKGASDTTVKGDSRKVTTTLDQGAVLNFNGNTEILKSTLSGASTFSLKGSSKAQTFNATLKGASTFNAIGVMTTDEFTVKADGSSTVMAEDLEIKKLDCICTTGSSVYVGKTTEIETKVTEASKLNYRGEPKFTKKESDITSTIEKSLL